MKYTIEKGKHSASGLQVGLHTGATEQTFRVTFDRSCEYPAIDSEDDTNKLFGWSYGILPFKKDGQWKPAHHNNSIRVGWRPHRELDYVAVCIYVYINGERFISQFVLNVPYDEPATFTLKNDYASGVITLTRIEYVRTSIHLTACIKPKFGYILYPFFGGNAPAPHTMTLNLKH